MNKFNKIANNFVAVTKVKTSVVEDFKMHESYLVGNKGTILNPKYKELTGKYIIRINGINTRKSNFIASVWLGKPSKKANVIHIDGNKLNYNIENLIYQKQRDTFKSYKTRVINLTKYNLYTY